MKNGAQDEVMERTAGKWVRWNCSLNDQSLGSSSVSRGTRRSGGRSVFGFCGVRFEAAGYAATGRSGRTLLEPASFFRSVFSATWLSRFTVA